MIGDRYSFALTSTTALLMHADIVIKSDQLKAWRDDPDNRKHKVAGDDRSPAWTWICYLYGDGKHIAMPEKNIMAALRFAAKKMPTGSKQETFGRLSQSGLQIETEYCEFASKNGQIPLVEIENLATLPFQKMCDEVKKLGFELDVQRLPVGTSKHVRVRPKFASWTVRGTIEVTEEQITSEVLSKMFSIAGQYAGLGDWRPSAKTAGRYGRFSAEVKKLRGK